MIVLGRSSLLSVASFILYSVSLTANLGGYDNIIKSHWAHQFHSSNIDVYYGFRDMAVHYGRNNKENHVYIIANYCDFNNSLGLSDDTCSQCGEHGQHTTVALVVTSLMLAFLSTILAFCHFCLSFRCNINSSVEHSLQLQFTQKPTTISMIIKDLQLTVMFLSCIFGISAFSYYSKCFDTIKVNGGAKHVIYGPGYAYCVTAVVLMLINFILNLVYRDNDTEPTEQIAVETAPVPIWEVTAERFDGAETENVVVTSIRDAQGTEDDSHDAELAAMAKQENKDGKTNSGAFQRISTYDEELALMEKQKGQSSSSSSSSSNT